MNTRRYLRALAIALLASIVIATIAYASVQFTKFGGLLVTSSGFGTTITRTIVNQNLTAAAVGAQQISGADERCGSGWKTTASAASQTVCSGFAELPVQNTTNPTATDVWYTNINGGGATARARFFFDPVASVTALYAAGNASGIEFPSAGVALACSGCSANGTLTYSGDVLKTANTSLVVGSSANYINTMFVDELESAGVASSCTTGTGAGTGGSPTCTVTNGSMLSSVITLVTGTAPAGNSGTPPTILTYTRGGSCQTIMICQLFPANTNAALLAPGHYWDDAAAGVSSALLKQAAVASTLAATTTYKWNVNCICGAH